MSEPRPPIPVERFIRLFTAHERRIFTYILAQLGHLADAEDVLQEVSVVLWQKIGEYEEGTNFTAWAFSIARHKVLQHRAKMAAAPLPFDDELVETLAADMESIGEELEQRHKALAVCLAKLPERDRDLMRRRYEAGATIKAIAAAVNRPLEGLYKAVRRIHRRLGECVDREIETEQT